MSVTEVGKTCKKKEKEKKCNELKMWTKTRAMKFKKQDIRFKIVYDYLSV